MSIREKILLVIAVLSVTSLLRHVSYANTTPSIETASQFRLVDASGNPRAVLSCSKDGDPSLSFLDSKGNKSIVIGLEGDSADISMKNPKNKASVRLTMQSDGTNGLALIDGSGKMRTGIRLRPDGSPLLTMDDTSGIPRVVLESRADGSPALLLSNSNQKGGAAVLVGANNDPAILFNSADGKLIWSVPSQTATKEQK